MPLSEVRKGKKRACAWPNRIVPAGMVLVLDASSSSSSSSSLFFFFFFF